MKMKHLSPQDYKTTNWSGGKTTELYIYPEEATYSKRDFYFRLSSATVDEEQSTFTKLENVQRELMLLKGSMKLVHKQAYEVQLLPYEKDSFSGDIETISYGKAVDFNLMTKRPVKGSITCIHLESNQQEVFITRAADEWFIEGFYCAQGRVQIKQGNITHLLEENEILLFENRDNEVLKLDMKEQLDRGSKVIAIRIQREQ